jgi:hypothetical protein
VPCKHYALHNDVLSAHHLDICTEQKAAGGPAHRPSAVLGALRVCPADGLLAKVANVTRKALAGAAQAVALAAAVGVAAERAQGGAAQATHLCLRRTWPERGAGLKAEVCNIERAVMTCCARVLLSLRLPVVEGAASVGAAQCCRDDSAAVSHDGGACRSITVS